MKYCRVFCYFHVHNVTLTQLFCRYSLEHDTDLASSNIVVKLSRIFCRNQTMIDDIKFKYFFLCNKPPEDSLGGITQWMVLLNWEAILCFDPHYGEEHGLYDHLLASKDFLR